MGAEEVKDAGRLLAGVGVVDLVTRELYRTIALKIGPTIEAGRISIGADVSSNSKAA